MFVTTEKPSLPQHTVYRYTLTILNGLYLVSAVAVTLLMIFRGVHLIPFIFCCLSTSLGLSGCYILWRRDDKLVKMYRSALLGVVALQMLAFISTLIVLLLRSYVAAIFFKNLMDGYHVDPSIKDMMDKVQLNFECCGLNSYKDWPTSIPASCCGKFATSCTPASTKLLGCKENLGMFILLICLALLFLLTGNIIFHTYCIRCALQLSKEYERAKNLF